MLTEKQHELLTLIADRCDKTLEGLRIYWEPAEREDWSDSLKKTVYVFGGGSTSMLRAFLRRGYTKKRGTTKYACEITEDGRLALEEYREKTGFYSK